MDLRRFTKAEVSGPEGKLLGQEFQGREFVVEAVRVPHGNQKAIGTCQGPLSIPGVEAGQSRKPVVETDQLLLCGSFILPQGEKSLWIFLLKCPT